MKAARADAMRSSAAGAIRTASPSQATRRKVSSVMSARSSRTTAIDSILRPSVAPRDDARVATPIVIDCDPGIDDAFALLLAIASPELDLRGVTTVAGNQTLERTTENALAVLELAGRADVPVAAGADRPLVQGLVTAAGRPRRQRRRRGQPARALHPGPSTGTPWTSSPSRPVEPILR